jgi:hypothetical protein
VNTEVVRHGSLHLQSRTQSQHRIQPSEKVVYESKTPSIKKGSETLVKGKSNDGKKKFISLVSSSAILASKLSFKEQNISSGK